MPNYGTYTYYTLKSQHLRKFVGGVGVINLFPIGNIEYTYVDEFGLNNIIYSKI